MRQSLDDEGLEWEGIHDAKARIRVLALDRSIGRGAPIFAQSTDSEFLKRVLSDVKTQALALQRDAAQLKAITQSSASWQSSADQLEQIKTDLNKITLLVQELNDFSHRRCPVGNRSRLTG